MRRKHKLDRPNPLQYEVSRYFDAKLDSLVHCPRRTPQHSVVGFRLLSTHMYYEGLRLLQLRRSLAFGNDQPNLLGSYSLHYARSCRCVAGDDRTRLHSRQAPLAPRLLVHGP